MDRSPTAAGCMEISKDNRDDVYRADVWSEHICNKIAGSMYKIMNLCCYL